MKAIKKIIFLFQFLLFIPLFTSCTKEDEDNPSDNSELIGTWYDIEENDVLLTFQNDGTLIWWESLGEYGGSGRYSYNPDEQTLSFWLDDENGTFKIIIGDDSFTLYDEDNYPSYFKKLDDPNIPNDEEEDENTDVNINLLYGSWYWEDGPYSKTRIIFRNNGTYNTEDYELNNDNWEIVGSDQGTWDLIGNRLYIDMEYAATILSLTKDKLVFMEDGENFVCYRQ